MKNTLLKGIFYLTGLLILSIGIDLSIIANVGASPWDALNAGLNKQFGLSIGKWAQIVGVVLIIIIAIMKKRRIEISPLLTTFILGNLIDFHFTWITLELNNVFYAWIAAIIGFTLISLGIAMYIQANFGFIPIDGFAIAIQQKTNWSLRISKATADFSALTIAFFLNGPIGIATIVSTIIIGPMFQFFYQLIQKRIKLT